MRMGMNAGKDSRRVGAMPRGFQTSDERLKSGNLISLISPGSSAKSPGNFGESRRRFLESPLLFRYTPRSYLKRKYLDKHIVITHG